MKAAQDERKGTVQTVGRARQMNDFTVSLNERATKEGVSSEEVEPFRNPFHCAMWSCARVRSIGHASTRVMLFRVQHGRADRKPPGRAGNDNQMIRG